VQGGVRAARSALERLAIGRQPQNHDAKTLTRPA
jgi:hypothetical protein